MPIISSLQFYLSGWSFSVQFPQSLQLEPVLDDEVELLTNPWLPSTVVVDMQTDVTLTLTCYCGHRRRRPTDRKRTTGNVATRVPFHWLSKAGCSCIRLIWTALSQYVNNMRAAAGNRAWELVSAREEFDCFLRIDELFEWDDCRYVAAVGCGRSCSMSSAFIATVCCRRRVDADDELFKIQTGGGPDSTIDRVRIYNSPNVGYRRVGVLQPQITDCVSGT